MKINSVIVIDIGSKLTLINLEAKGGIKISALKVIDLPQEHLEDVILKAVQDFITENNIRHRNVILKPSLNSLFIKRLQLPVVPDKELAEAIRWQIKEDAHYDLSGAILDYSIIKKITKEDGSKVEDIICVTAKEEELKRWVLLLKQIGINCLSVGLLPFSYEKLIQRYYKEEKDKTICVLHIDDDSCHILIFQDNKLDFYRELPISINKLRESLKSVLTSDRGRIEFSHAEIEEILFNVGIPGSNFVYKDRFNAAQILGMLRPVLERLTMEIKRSFIYYRSQFKAREVSEVFISGDMVRINNIESFLSKELLLKVTKLSLEDKVEVHPDIDKKDFAYIVACLGLVIDYRESINLLPYEFRREKFETTERIFIRWMAFVTFLLFFVPFILAKASVKLDERRLESLRFQLNVLSEVKDTKTKLDQLDNLVKQIKSSEYPLGNMFRKLSNIAPDGLFIVDFSIDNISHIGSMKGYVKADTDPSALLAKFINDMKKSMYFSEANIASVQKNKYQDAEVTEFNINFKLS